MTVGSAIFQVVHAVEHFAQVGYWVIHPTDAPWVTPWAAYLVTGLSPYGPPGMGVELLHLIGNLIFFFGVVFLAILVRVIGGSVAAARATKLTLWVQGIHVLEHVALTLSLAMTGRAMGLSTVFGAITGPSLFTYRIWWHFAINLVGTILLARALWQLRPALATARHRETPFSGWAVAPWPAATSAQPREKRDVAAVAKLGPMIFAFHLAGAPREAPATETAATEALDLALSRAARTADDAREAAPAAGADTASGPTDQAIARKPGPVLSKARDLGLRIATVVAAVATVVLAVHISFVLLGANEHNVLVSFFCARADEFALGFQDVFVNPDPRASALVNYGLAGLLYLFAWRALVHLRKPT
ncbi:MAG: hypothetical protein GEU94_03965 [Micromonosporaceae bacterium]|nr:hypothetical protein [Micromonosporaceae bacterium]